MADAAGARLARTQWWRHAFAPTGEAEETGVADVTDEAVDAAALEAWQREMASRVLQASLRLAASARYGAVRCVRFADSDTEASAAVFALWRADRFPGAWHKRAAYFNDFEETIVECASLTPVHRQAIDRAFTDCSAAVAEAEDALVAGAASDWLRLDAVCATTVADWELAVRAAAAEARRRRMRLMLRVDADDDDGSGGNGGGGGGGGCGGRAQVEAAERCGLALVATVNAKHMAPVLLLATPAVLPPSALQPPLRG